MTYDVGLAEPAYPTQTASWADYDLDGDLDLFIGNEHGTGGPASASRGGAPFDAPSQLFRNDGGRFTDVSASAGIRVRAFVKGVVWGDYDADRFPDLYVSVLGGENLLFRNRGDGTFEERSRRAGVTGPRNSFPVWFWDFDNDGHLDLYVPSYRGSEDGVAFVAGSAFGLDVPYDHPSLYRGDGRGGFVDVASRVGLDRIHLPMGSNFGDLDSDGWLDFYLGTGYPDYEAQMPNVLYRNRAGVFEDVTFALGVGHLQKGHAVVFADYDRDGDQDLFAQMGGAFPGDRFGNALFDNPGNGNRWLALRLQGVTSNRSAIGARIRAEFVSDGARRVVHRRVNSGGSFGANPLTQTLGLARAESVERLEIYWPASDLEQVFTDVGVNQRLQVVEGDGTLRRIDVEVDLAR